MVFDGAKQVAKKAAQRAKRAVKAKAKQKVLNIALRHSALVEDGREGPLTKTAERAVVLAADKVQIPKTLKQIGIGGGVTVGMIAALFAQAVGIYEVHAEVLSSAWDVLFTSEGWRIILDSDRLAPMVGNLAAAAGAITAVLIKGWGYVKAIV